MITGELKSKAIRVKTGTLVLDELSECELAGPVDGHEEVELAFSGLHLGDVDVEEADRVSLELALGLLLALDVGQPGDAVALQAAM